MPPPPGLFSTSTGWPRYLCCHLGELAQVRVGRAAGRPRADEGDRLRRKWLRRRRRCESGEHDARECSYCAHPPPPGGDYSEQGAARITAPPPCLMSPAAISPPVSPAPAPWAAASRRCLRNAA